MELIWLNFVGVIFRVSFIDLVTKSYVNYADYDSHVNDYSVLFIMENCMAIIYNRHFVFIAIKSVIRVKMRLQNYDLVSKTDVYNFVPTLLGVLV